MSLDLLSNSPIEPSAMFISYLPRQIAASFVAFDNPKLCRVQPAHLAATTLGVFDQGARSAAPPPPSRRQEVIRCPASVHRPHLGRTAKVCRVVSGITRRAGPQCGVQSGCSVGGDGRRRWHHKTHPCPSWAEGGGSRGTYQSGQVLGSSFPLSQLPLQDEINAAGLFGQPSVLDQRSGAVQSGGAPR
jgi:hypothetical protein